jgi:type VI secretion system protein
MAREQSLLDRLGTLGSGSRARYEASATENVELLMESVRRNLVRLLNSRQGMSEAVLDYGLPSLTDITTTSTDYVQVVIEEIRKVVEKYEPRLKHIRVTALKTEDEKVAAGTQNLACRIEATLIGRDSEHRVWYETNMEGDGRYGVYG